MLEVISTLLLNFVAEALVSFVVQGPLQERQGIYPQSDPIALSARLPLVPAPVSMPACSSHSGAPACCGISSRGPDGDSCSGRWAPGPGRRR